LPGSKRDDGMAAINYVCCVLCCAMRCDVLRCWLSVLLIASAASGGRPAIGAVGVLSGPACTRPRECGNEGVCWVGVERDDSGSKTNVLSVGLGMLSARTAWTLGKEDGATDVRRLAALFPASARPNSSLAHLLPLETLRHGPTQKLLEPYANGCTPRPIRRGSREQCESGRWLKSWRAARCDTLLHALLHARRAQWIGLMLRAALFSSWPRVAFAKSSGAQLSTFQC
jgi:hypothetical protein